MKEVNRNISRNVKNYLEILDISQNELAEMLGCSSSTVSMWIGGKATPRIDKIDMMCSIFHCQRQDLLNESMKEKTEIEADQITAAFAEKFQRLEPQRRLQLLAYMEKLLKLQRKTEEEKDGKEI